MQSLRTCRKTMMNFNSYLFLYWQGLNVRGGRFLISFESRNFFKKNRTKWELDVSSRSKVNPYDPKVFTNFFVFSIRDETSAMSSFPPRRRIRFASRINWEASVAINERQNIATSTVVSSNGTFLMSHGMTLKITLYAIICIQIGEVKYTALVKYTCQSVALLLKCKTPWRFLTKDRILLSLIMDHKLEWTVFVGPITYRSLCLIKSNECTVFCTAAAIFASPHPRSAITCFLGTLLRTCFIRTVTGLTGHRWTWRENPSWYIFADASSRISSDLSAR